MSDVWKSFREYDLEQRKARQAALQRLKEQRKERPTSSISPIELAFILAWREAFPDIELLQQYHILKFRVDFAHIETKTVIEIDGHKFHSSRKDRNKDYTRQHDIEDQGWYFIRFTGSQIHNDVESCVSLVHSRIMARSG